MFKRFNANAFGTRTKLMALLLLAIVPLCGLVVHGAVTRYQLLMNTSHQQALQLAIVLADRNSALIENTRNILQTLANSQAIREGDWSRCNNVLSQFHQFFSASFSTFHVATPDGDVKCSATPLSGPINIADRADFATLLATGEFVMGDVIHSRTTNLVSVSARYPVRRGGNQIVAVISAQVSSIQFEMATLSTPVPKGGELLILNGQHETLMHMSNNAKTIGEVYPSNDLWYAMRRNQSGVIDTKGEDGMSRIYGYARAEVDDGSWMYVAIGFPLETIQQDIYRNLLQSMTTALLVAITVLALAWFGVEQLVLRKVRVLVNTVTRLRDGDSQARTGLDYGNDELCRIARAIDDTAEELESAMESLREQTVRDPLTSLYNRRYMEETLARELQTSERRGWHLGVIMADIDHFKRFNDTYGHDLGDQVLKAVAEVMTNNVRGGDTVCRFGGEEFAIILPGTPIDIAAGRAEAIREAISQVRLLYEGTDIGIITMSFGVAVYPDMGGDIHTLIRNADSALYNAKHNGRNRVALAIDALLP